MTQHVLATALLSAALMPAAAQAHCCCRPPVAVQVRELPALEVAPNVYVVGKPAGPRAYPYAGRRAYWWAYRHDRTFARTY